MRILFVFGTRPEAIKLFPLIHVARLRRDWTALVCVTAQHRSMLDQVLSLSGIVPDFDLNVMKPNQDLGGLTAACLTGIQGVVRQVKPDIVVVQGDTTTAFAGALAAFYEKVAVAHVEAGLRSGNMQAPWPEEANRKLVAAITDIHLAPTAAARQALLAEGVDAAAIHVTGNTVVDALLWMRERLAETAFQVPGLAETPKGKRMILVTTHRRENFDGGIKRIAQAIARLSARDDVEIVFPVHLNPNVRGPVQDVLSSRANVHLLEPQDYLPFVQLMSRATLIITDSGGVQEEAPVFGVPVLVTRETTERRESIEAGTAKLVGSDEDLIVTTASTLLDKPQAYAAMSRKHSAFGDGRAAERIIGILQAWRDART
ncbi:MAG TPA: UDP-N-acetylglucosamine 2-epimerase (non-hydrolyzing) [Rhizomicrobium sp.]